MRKSSSNFLSAVSKSASAVLWTCILALHSAHAQSPSPSVTIDLANIRELKVEESRRNESGNQFQIGDRIPLYVSIPPDLATSGDSLELRAPDKGSKLEDQGWYLDRAHQFENGNFRFIVSPIQTGNLSLPTLVIIKNNSLAIARTSPFTIKVSGPEKKDQNPPELLDITQTSLPLKYVILFLIVAIGASLLVFFIYRKLSKKKPSRPEPVIPPIVDPAHRIALRRIEQIYEKYPYSIENLKPVAFELSEVLKEFFSSRFKVDALEATTSEMLDLLRREAVSDESIREIQKLFIDLDLIKFTKSENYAHFDSKKYTQLKDLSQGIVQKWALEKIS